MTNTPKTVLAIHDLPGFGRAALSVIVPVLSTLGVQTVALTTAVLSTHTGGLGTPAKLANPGYGPVALEHYHRLGVKFDCIYSGYLADAAQAKLVEQAFELWPRAFKVVDPVLGDGGRLYSGLGADMVPAMYSLCSKADLIVPNVTEAALLLDVPMPAPLSRREAVDMLDALHRVTDGDAVITSALLRDYPDSVCTIARDEESAFAVVAPRVPGTYPGAGDIFTSVLTGALLRGEVLPAAVRRAAAFVSRCMVYTHEAGAPTREGVLLERCLAHVLDAPEGVRTVPLREG